MMLHIRYGTSDSWISTSGSKKYKNNISSFLWPNKKNFKEIEWNGTFCNVFAKENCLTPNSWNPFSILKYLVVYTRVPSRFELAWVLDWTFKHKIRNVYLNLCSQNWAHLIFDICNEMWQIVKVVLPNYLILNLEILILNRL